MTDTIKTLKDLAELVKEKEAELAPGSETSMLGAFVHDFDFVSRILDGDTDLDVDQDVTYDYEAYEEAYARMERWEADGVDYDNDMLWA